MSNRPQMLLMVPDTTDFRADLAKFGIADRFEIADVKPETRPTPDQLERAEIILSAWVQR